MKSLLINSIALTVLLISSNSFAIEMPDLAKKYACTGCHAIDKKLMGPAWQEVANKYKGDSQAEAKLNEKIAKGGSGVWGAMSMPAMSAVSDADRKTLISFILGLAK
ncbi:MAG: c-type cytochrome [Methylococcaceae bacterium]